VAAVAVAAATAAVAVAVVVATAETAVVGVGDIAADFAPIANDIGHAWVAELVGAFRADERDIVGAWPGTISEARMRVLARVGRKVDLDVLDSIARVARLVAQQQWQLITQPDPEP
jgi:hypothetical protein